MMRFLWLAMLCTLIPSLGGMAAPPARAASTSPRDALGAYLGTWTGEGKFLDTAYSQAGSVGAITECHWSAKQTFLVCDQQTHSPAGPSEDLSIYSYNETRHEYEFFGLSRNSSEVRTPKLTIQGAHWTYSSEFTNKAGKRVMTRTTNEFTSLTTVTYRIEYSLDGTRWTLMGSGSSHRVK